MNMDCKRINETEPHKNCDDNLQNIAHFFYVPANTKQYQIDLLSLMYVFYLLSTFV